MTSTKNHFRSYALLGSGRVARHLEFYLKSLNLPFLTWSRRDDSMPRLAEVVRESSHVLFAVRDDAVETLAAPFVGPDKILVHFSGSLHLPGVHSAHPLMTFGECLEDAEWYSLIPFVLAQGLTLNELLPGLPNRSWSIPSEVQPLYHALCSLAANSAFLLWQSIGDEFENTLSLPRHLLQPLLLQTVLNSSHPTLANFTGPVARGDWETVRRHLNSLDTQPALRKAYCSYLELAQQSGHMVPEALL